MAIWYILSIAILILTSLFGTFLFSTLTIALIALYLAEDSKEIFIWDRDYVKLIMVLSFYFFLSRMHSGYYATWVTDMLPTTQLPTNWKISVPEDLPAAWLDFEYYLDGVLVAPIAEEIIFRWFLIGKAKKRAWAILLSAVLFSTVHLNSKNYLDLDTQLYFQAIYLPIGLAYTFLYLRYGLVYSIAAHALSNTYLLLVKLYPTPTKTAALIFMLLGLVLFFRKIIKSQRS